MLLMIPTAYICFVSFDLISLLTGGLITNFQGLAGALGGAGQILIFIIGAFLGVMLVCLFPIHWVLINQPDNVILLLAITLPWIITCSVASFLFAHTPRGGIHTSLAIGIGYFIFMLIPYILFSVLLAPLGGSAIIDNLSMGLTDLPWVLAALTATMEGAGVGAVFGGLVGSLKYNPEGSSKKSKKSSEYVYEPEPTVDVSSTSTRPIVSADAHCTNCGAKLIPGDEFCTNCGNRIK